MALDHQVLVGIESDSRSEPSRFPIECLLDPFDVMARGTEKSKVLDLQGNQFKCVEGSRWLVPGRRSTSAPDNHGSARNHEFLHSRSENRRSHLE